MNKAAKNNFKSKVLLLCSFLFILLLSSCEEVVNLDLETGEAKIVIDAEIIWNKDTDGKVQTIKISKMAPYYNTSTPKVSGAQVRVENSEGTVFTFTETEPGFYVCNDFVPVLNMEYTLFVEAEGKSFTAVEKMTPVTPIKRIEQEYRPDISGPDLLVLSIFYDDPADQQNFYLSYFTTDFLKIPYTLMSNDDLYNGNEITDEFSDTDLKPGKTVQIVHRGISKNVYNYMNLIFEASSANPFGTTPGNIRGNIVNTNDTKDFALGYFRLCEANSVSYTMK
ncbi:DUF4249 domain-containing protein [Flavobacterium pectinovorum]|uniref:DUF4249 domain-containing protein n=1 Tax=Flavobacterium pectinovorum TaxID=29533 RepID=UPI001FAD5BDC|nr:DUF4249 domain-containing protein [Flavobacterium pectinovorum]MCI9846869.1 DUF4249 domain-containing protein [Flavobacterium pectinovorum]